MFVCMRYSQELVQIEKFFSYFGFTQEGYSLFFPQINVGESAGLVLQYNLNDNDA